MTLAEMSSILRTNGLLLNNFYQLDSGAYRVSVRSLGAGLHYHFATHADPDTAFLHAIAAAGTPGVSPRHNNPTVKGASRPAPIPLADLDLSL
jgi:hypothetical protein